MKYNHCRKTAKIKILRWDKLTNLPKKLGEKKTNQGGGENNLTIYNFALFAKSPIYNPIYIHIINPNQPLSEKGKVAKC